MDIKPLSDVTKIHSLPAPQRDMTILFELVHAFGEKYDCDVHVELVEKAHDEPRTYFMPKESLMDKLTKEHT